MSLSSALSVSLSGLHTISTLMQLTANNVSNAQTAGYTEKSANIQSVDLGGAGGGTRITGYSRATNTALTTSVNQATSQAKMLGTQNSYMQQVQSILDSSDVNGNPAISTAVSNFQAAWTQFSAAPESSIQQNNLIQAGTTLAEQLSSAANAVHNLDVQVQTDTSTTVSTLNSDLSQIASLNQQIATALGAGQSAGDIEDQRDQLVNNIAGITGVTVFQRGQGQIALYTPGGTVLLDGSPQKFSYDGTNITSSNGQTVTTLLTGGSLQAQINFRANSSPTTASSNPLTEVIRKLDSQLDTIANAFTANLTATKSGQNVTIGGVPGQTTPAQTASITVNGTAYSYTVQTGDTTTMIATHLAALVTAGGVASTSSGNVVTIGGSGTINSIATTNGQPPSFAAAYTGGVTSVPSFFTGTDAGSLAVNSSLTADPTTVNQATANNVVMALNTTGRSFTAQGMATLSNASYATLTTTILTNFQQTANSIKTTSAASTAQQQQLSTQLANATGVNTDTELVNLTSFQNAYAASAHVISVIDAMYAALENIT